MVIKTYEFTHDFGDESLRFCVSDLGNAKTVTINDTYDLIPTRLNYYEFFDRSGRKHEMIFRKTLLGNRVFIDGKQYNYLSETTAVDYIMAYLPFITVFWQGLGSILNFFVNAYILRNYKLDNNAKIAVCSATTLISSIVFYTIGSNILNIF